jgi:hypothetical protein
MSGRASDFTAAGSIIALAASDRPNYGDLVFPHVVRWAANACLPSHPFVSVAHSACPHIVDFGGIAPIALQRMLAEMRLGRHKPSLFVVAGGEVLGAQWAGMDRNLKHRFIHRLIKVMGGFAGESLSERLWRRGMGVEWSLPFVPPPGGVEFDGVPVAYNSVGGSGIHSLSRRAIDALLAGLSQAAHISVRDRVALNFLNQHGLQASLVPDSAVLMSTIFGDELTRQRSPVEVSGRYMALQCSRFEYRQAPALYREVVRVARERLGLGVVLLVIGAAAGHEDAESIRRSGLLSAGVGGVASDETANMLNIMRTIKDAELFVGTSLHGVITAQSFGVPYAPLTNVAKLLEYLRTWGLPGADAPLTFDTLERDLRRALDIDRSALRAQADRQRGMALDNFRTMYNLVG